MRLFNDTVYVKFRLWFTIANYENDIFSLCRRSNACIRVLRDSKMHFHQRGPLELIKTMLDYFHVMLGLSLVWNSYPKGSTQ